MTGPTTIPPPSEADRGDDLLELSTAWNDGSRGWDDEILGTIRRCLAAESDVAAIRELLRPVLGTEPCPRCEGRRFHCAMCNGSGTTESTSPAGGVIYCPCTYDDEGFYEGRCLEECDACSGAGTRDVVDGLPSVVEAVKRLTWRLNTDSQLITIACLRAEVETRCAERDSLKALLCKPTTPETNRP